MIDTTSGLDHSALTHPPVGITRWDTTPAPILRGSHFAPTPRFPALDGGDLRDVLNRNLGKPRILVLGLPRSGTKTLLHFFTNACGETHKVVHAHGLGVRYRQTLEDGAAKGLPGFDDKVRTFARTQKIMSMATPLTVFVAMRDPLLRIPSFYLYANRDRIGDFFDPETRNFRCRTQIEADFSTFAMDQAAWETAWYREELLEPFGFDIRSVSNLSEGAYVSTIAGTTFVVLKCESMTPTFESSLQKVHGWPQVQLATRNSSEEHSIAQLAKSFRQTFPLGDSATLILRESPTSFLYA